MYKKVPGALMNLYLKLYTTQNKRDGFYQEWVVKTFQNALKDACPVIDHIISTFTEESSELSV